MSQPTARPLILLLLGISFSTGIAEPGGDSPSNAVLRSYLAQQVQRRSDAEPCLAITRDNWPREKARLRLELSEMLGLFPPRERSDLKPVVTGNVERAGIVVEKLHFQSSPGLYVTANFYRPKVVEKPLPTILYLCGHARVNHDGVSYGNKVGYQHHGAWFARHGYCCLTIDTVQLGEIEGVHHGTYKLGMWWWIARGYTPAGVEAWNAMRAIDYLETRPEVDRANIGVTGRSGGGAYSWWVAALDDRPVCFVPVAGITDLENHIVDNCIEGHCDCMFMQNRRGWDFATVASLTAPRPCLLSNTDKDRIFPLEGVLRVHQKLKKVYHQLDAEDKLGLLITEGPHVDTQDLQVPAFRWFHRWLKGVDEPITVAAEKLFTPDELKVFSQIPDDQINTRIHEEFVPLAVIPDPPTDLVSWNKLRQHWLEQLKIRCFSAWPDSPAALDVKTTTEEGSNARRTIDFTGEEGLRLQIDLVGSSSPDAPLTLHVLDEQGKTYADRSPLQTPAGETWAFVAPRDSGKGRWAGSEQDRRHAARRFALLGYPIDEGRVWDVRRALDALRQTLGERPAISLAGRGNSAGIALYVSVFEEGVEDVYLDQLSTSHRDGPIFMNVLRVLDIPQAVALVFPKRVHIRGRQPSAWTWPHAVASLYPESSSLLTFSNE